jgi:hypothetical protein
MIRNFVANFSVCSFIITVQFQYHYDVENLITRLKLRIFKANIQLKSTCNRDNKSAPENHISVASVPCRSPMNPALPADQCAGWNVSLYCPHSYTYLIRPVDIDWGTETPFHGHCYARCTNKSASWVVDDLTSFISTNRILPSAVARYSGTGQGTSCRSHFSIHST